MPTARSTRSRVLNGGWEIVGLEIVESVGSENLLDNPLSNSANNFNAFDAAFMNYDKSASE